MDAIKEREAWQSFKLHNEKSIEEVLLKGQQYFVFQAAHADTSIKSPDSNAWIRAIGFTQTIDAARELARTAHDVSGKTETRIMPCGKNFLIGKHKYDGLDLPLREKEQQKSNAMIDAHIQSRLNDISSAISAAKNKKVNEDDNATQEVQEQAQTGTLELHEDSDILVRSSANLASLLRYDAPTNNDAENSSNLSNAASNTEPLFAKVSKSSNKEYELVGKVLQVNLQRVFAIAVVQDPDDLEREPSLIPLFACDSADEIQPLVKEAQQSKDLMHFDVLVGPTAEWLPLYKPKSEKTLHQHPLRQELENNIKWLDA